MIKCRSVMAAVILGGLGMSVGLADSPIRYPETKRANLVETLHGTRSEEHTSELQSRI